jgi:hypothetical protein
LVWKPKGNREEQEDGGVEGRITLKQIVKKQCRSVWTGFIWLKIGTNGGLF